MKLKDSGAYAPFEVELQDLFEVSEEEGLFRKTQRLFLIHNIIESDEEIGGAQINLDHELKSGVISRVYPLHTEPKRLALLEDWASPKKLFTPQPLERIRDYFGEEITIYFAWLGFYTQWMWYATAFGTVITFFWAVTFFTEGRNSWTLWSITIYCLFLALWSTAFLEFWKRFNNELVYKWGMREWIDQERERPEFQGELLMGVYSGGVWVPLNPDAKYGFKLPPPQKYSSTQKRRAKGGIQLPIVCFMIALMVTLTISVLSFRLFVQTLQPLAGSIVGGIANAITIIFMNTLWNKVAVFLTNWENYRTESEYSNALIYKIFTLYFVNSYTSLFYIAFFKGSGKIFGASQLADSCKTGRIITVVGEGCMDEVTIQLVTILLTNMFIGQAKEVGVPWLKSKIKTWLLKRRIAKGLEAEKEPEQLAQWEIEGKKENYTGTFDEYCEMVIQFGYVTMFAASFPLAPLLAVLNNVVEIRTDALKLLTAHSRPEYRGASGIGAWYNILEFLGIASVLTNCLLIGFSVDSIADAFGGMPLTLASQRISQVPYYTLIVIVVIEHFLLGTKFLLAYMIPDMPGWIVKELAKEEWIKEKTIKALEKKVAPKLWKDEIATSAEDIIEDKQAQDVL